MNALQIAKMAIKRALASSMAAIALSFLTRSALIYASETNATATVAVTMNSITPVGEISILVPSGMEFRVDSMEGGKLIVSKGPFVGSVALSASSLWKPAPSVTPTPSSKKVSSPIHPAFRNLLSHVTDHAKQGGLLLLKSFKEDPVVVVILLLLGALLVIFVLLVFPPSLFHDKKSRGIIKKLNRELENLRVRSAVYVSEISEMEKSLLATSVQLQEAEKKLKATIEQESPKINSLREQLDASRNLAEEQKIEIIDLEERLSENLLTDSERLKQLGDLLARERNLGKEALSAAEDKIVSLQSESNLLIAQRNEWESERKVLLDQIVACEGKFVSLEERFRSHEEHFAKSASAPCPHCDQPVKLILLEKGSNKCPKCSGDIFCE